MAFRARLKEHTAKTKIMPKTKKSVIKSRLGRRPLLVLMAVLFGLTAVTGGFVASKNNGALAATANCDSISECRDEISQTESIVEKLKSKALSYQNAIDILNAEINQLQRSIDRNTARQNELEKQIAQKKKEIEYQREVLGQNLRAMYVDDQMSTIEMLATSNNLSDYVDKSQYRYAVQNKIQETLDKIAKLQAELRAQKDRVEHLIAKEKEERTEVASARAEQQSLLAYNQNQRNAYNAQTAANQERLQELIEAQRRANASPSAGGYYFIDFPGEAVRSPMNGSYPYSGSGFSMAFGGCGQVGPPYGQRDATDRWGYCTRQCVSYAAWAVEYSGQSAPYYYGDAKEWVYNARADGIPVNSTPSPGDVAISTSGTWGHAMYVEKVSGDSIYVSQYNQSLDGQFSTQWRQWR